MRTLHQFPDVTLFALRPEWDRLSVAQDAASHALARAQELCDEDRAPVPAPLLAKAGDDMLVWLDVTPTVCRYKGAAGDEWYGDEETLPALDAALTRAREVDQRGDYDRRLIGRLTAILADHTLWNGHRRAVEVQHGLRHRTDEFLAAEARCSDVRRKIAVIPATTMVGLQFKVEVAFWGYDAAIEDVAARLRAKALSEVPYGPSVQTMAELILVDLKRITVEAEREADDIE